MSSNGHAALAPERCRQLLGEAQVGRVVFTRRALPAVVPVRYVLEADDLVLHPASGADWPRHVAGTVIAFQVDQFGDPGKQDWSVVVIAPVQSIRHSRGDRIVLDLSSALLTGTAGAPVAQVTA